MAERQSEKKLRDVPPGLQFITLDEIAGRLADLFEVQTRILKHLEETTPEGVDVPIPEKTVTSPKPTIIDLTHIPLRSVDFFNKGPDTAYYRINNDPKEIPIEDREEITAQRPKATIKYVTLRVDAGDTAKVKMVGHY